MKKHRLTAMAAALCLLCTGIPAAAAPFTTLSASAEDTEELTSGALTYVIENDSITITKCDAKAETVEIPSEIDGVPVKSIGSLAFYSCALTSVTIPEGVEVLRSGAFWHSKNLTEVKLPSTLTAIEDNVFNDCKKLETIQFPESLTSIGNAAFTDTAWLTAQKEISDFVIVNGILIDASKAVATLRNAYLEEKERQEKEAEEAKIWKRAQIITNQIGYFPTLQKQATLVTDAAEAVAFELLDADGNAVFTGTSTPFGADPDSGDTVQILDFTAFQEEGVYTLRAGEAVSRAFTIGVKDAYSGLLYDSLNYFYQARSGIAIEEQYISSGDKAALAREAAHVPDLGTIQNIWDYDGSSGEQDVTGGWYDAGDHGKYVVNGGISLWLLQNQYERAALKGTDAPYADGTMLLPENANGNPDLLDEARYEMEWMLKMVVQDGDYAGMAYHKVHDSKWTALALDPAHDMQPRWILPPSTAATLNLAACAAQSARLWKDLDPDFSETCLNAAKTAYAAAKAHPDIYAPNKEYGGGGAYNDDNVTDEFYWAATELWLTTQDSTYYDDLAASEWALAVPVDMNAVDASSFTGIFDWGHTAALGSLSLLLHPEVLQEDSAATLQTNLKAAADAYVGYAAGQGYGVPFKAENGEYPWGSNSFIADNAIVLAYAYDNTGDTAYLNTMVGAMDYLLGRNPLDFSYVTGYGVHSAQYPHHRWWAVSLNDSFPKAPCGVLVGGPNTGRQDTAIQMAKIPADTAPQLVYLDDIEAYSTNEVTINWNSPLAWVTSFLLEQNGGITVSEPSHGVQIPEPEPDPAEDPNYVPPLSVTIPETVTAIGEQIFGANRDYVTEVIIPEGVTSIGKEAFYRCKLLNSITLPTTLTNVGDNAFANTPWLQAQLAESPLLIMNGLVIDGKSCKGNVVLPAGTTAILGSAFQLNTEITSITLPEGLTSIGDSAFQNCENLTNVILPSTLETIGKNAFNTTGLTSLRIPERVKNIGELAFANCKNLMSATVLSPDAVIGKEALGWTSTFTLTGQYAYIFIDLPVEGFVLRCLSGSTAAVYAGASEVTAKYIDAELLLGDLDGNEQINASDAAQVLIACAEMGAGYTDVLTETEATAADVDGNGEINAGDATIILQYAAYAGAGGTDSFPDFVMSTKPATPAE